MSTGEKEVVVRGVKDKCYICGVTIGMAGRTKEEFAQAWEDKTFRTAFGSVDWSQDPAVMTYYCGKHLNT